MPSLSLGLPKVLVLEDGALIPTDMASTLADAKYKVRTALTATDALVLLTAYDFDVAVLVVGLQLDDSLAVADVLMKRAIPFAFCTSYWMPIPVAYGVAPVITKPFTDEAIIVLVESLLALPRGTLSRETSGRHAHRPGDGQKETLIDTLTRREREILALVVGGSSSRKAAARLGISARTVEFHRANIMDKLAARNVADLLRVVLTSNWSGLVTLAAIETDEPTTARRKLVPPSA